MIVADDIHMYFGGIRAVDGASIRIETGSITGLIGPNGAGKTTLFNVIAGHYTPTKGRVLLDGEDVTGLKPHELFAKGLLRTFQIAHEFGSCAPAKCGRMNAPCSKRSMRSSIFCKSHMSPMSWPGTSRADRKNCSNSGAQ